MQKYSNNIQDQFGNELTGATITVRNNTGGALSAIFSDDGVTPKANPFVAATSEFFFYAANSRYDIFITGPYIDEELDVLLFDDVGVVGIQGLPSVLAIDPLTVLDAQFDAGAAVIFSNGALDANFSMGASNFATVFTSTPNWDLTGLTRFRMNGGAIALLEIASAPTDVLTYGQFWVRASDGNAMFTNETGTDFVLNVPGVLQGVLDAGNTSTTDAQFITGAGIDFFSPDDVSDVHVSVIEPGLFPYLSFVSTAAVEEYRFDKDINIPGLDLFIGSGRFGFYNRGDSVDNYIENDASGELELVSVAEALRVNADSIRLSEQASPSGDVASYGQFWVQSEGDNVPMFTSDAGTEQLLDPSRSDINEQNGNYTFVLADKGKTIRKASGGAGETYTIPASGAVAYKIGTLIAIRNDGGGDLSVAITTDTLTPTSGAAGTQTLGDAQTAIIQKIAATEWSYAASDI